MKHALLKTVNVSRGQRVTDFQSQLDALQAQITAMQAQLDQKTSQDDVVNLIGERAACNCGDVDDLQLAVSNPPAQAEVQSMADKLHELMFALKGE